MGRVTEFIHYINSKHEPDPTEKACEYTHISFIDSTKEVRKKHQKKIKADLK